MKKLYVDDLSELESVKLISSLAKIENFVGPLNYHERCGWELPKENSILQHKLEDIQNFTQKNMMLVNKKKSMIMPFNFTNSYDFIPWLNFPGEDPLKVIYETKLLGITLRSDLSFSSHVDNICRKAKQNLWTLIRFRNMGANIDQLMTIWQQKSRSVLEFASTVFFSRLSQEQKTQMENCQRSAFAIILEKNYNGYEAALITLGQDTLENRRTQAALRFGEKCLTHPQHSHMFPKNEDINYSLRTRKPYKEYFCKTLRMFKSSLPTITRLLNDKHQSDKGA